MKMIKPKHTTDEVLVQLRAHKDNAIVLCYGPKLRLGALLKRAIAVIERQRRELDELTLAALRTAEPAPEDKP